MPFKMNPARMKKPKRHNCHRPRFSSLPGIDVVLSRSVFEATSADSC